MKSTFGSRAAYRSRSGTLTPKSRSLVLSLLLIFGLGGLAMLLSHHVVLATNPLDFRAFYCAGAVVLHGADPYLAEPLRSCEAAAMRIAGLSAIPYLALPAPLPGYALPIFMLAARTDFATASTLFAVVSVVAVGITAATLRRLTSLSIVTIFAALAVADGYLGLVNGQLVPIFTMLLCLAALSIHLEKPWFAAFFCAGTTIEPHLALPACASLALYMPRARLPLALFGTVLCATSIATLGAARNLEYLATVLPAHVSSEATNAGQYSLTSMLFHAGIPVGAAIRAGEVSYVIAVAAGLAIASGLRQRPGGAAFVVLLPVAFASFGGSFIHLVQIGAAIPSALLFVARYPDKRPQVVTALSFLSIPWLGLSHAAGVTNLGLIVTAACVCLTVVWPLLRERSAPFAAVLITTLLFCAGGLFALGTLKVQTPADPVPAMARVAGARELAESTWTVYERISQSRETAPILFAKIPTWFGLAVLLLFAIRVRTVGCNPRRSPPNPRELSRY